MGKDVRWILIAFGGAAIGLAAPSAPVSATPFLISNCQGCVQSEIAVAGAPNGDFLAIWQGAQSNGDGVFGKAFAPGRSLAAFAVDPQMPANPPQYQPDVAVDSSGNYVAVWGTTKEDVSTIMAQRFDLRGAAVGEVIEVASADSAFPGNPALQNPTVATTPTGGFFVAWVAQAPSTTTAGTPPTVMARRYNAAGVAAGNAIPLSTGLALSDRPSICVDLRNRLVASWTFADSFQPFEANKVGVALRRFSIHDVPFGPELVVSPATAESASTAVSCGNRASFVVTWSTDGTDGDRTAVLAQRFSYNGLAQAAPMQVNATMAGSENTAPVIHHDAAGNFLILWDEEDSSGHRLLIRTFAQNGTAIDGPVQLVEASTSSPAFRPRFSAIGADRFIVLWTLGQTAYAERVILSAP